MRRLWALVLALASCQPVSTRPLAPEAPVSLGSLEGFGFFRPSPAVEADLDGPQAASAGVLAVLLSLPEKERGRLLARWLPPVTVPLHVPEAIQAPMPPLDSVDVLTTLRSLHQTQGSRDLALAAFFVGPEAVMRVRQRSRLPPERLDLDQLSNRLPSRERRALRLAREARDLAVLFGLAWPVERDWRLTSRFGPRLHPIHGRQSEHRGVDIGVPEGTAVRAPADGVVIGVREGPVNGRSLELRHEAGVSTLYCHLSLVEVKQGQKVSAGERVARSGETGRVTGPHLHYQVRRAGTWLDPVSLRLSAEHLARPLPLPTEPRPEPRPEPIQAPAL